MFTKILTGYQRNGYCQPNQFDSGNHLVCAKMDSEFMKFTARDGNDLSNVVKPNENGVYVKTVI